MSLTLDFYESGVGETILLTFPCGSKGIVDAHPSQGGVVRVLDSIKGQSLKFVCLTHPHEDHGLGLIPILNDHSVEEFWHTVSGIQAWTYSTEEIPTFPVHFREVIERYMKKTGNFVRELFGTAYGNIETIRTLHAGISPLSIGGVKIHFLGPEEEEQTKALKAYSEIAKGTRKNPPDPNALSAILALEYNGTVIILGGDALIKNWKAAFKTYRRLGLNKASLLKIPHHGASNAFDLSGGSTYLAMVEKQALGILFAGDSQHPDPRVIPKLNENLSVHCLANGGRHGLVSTSVSNPLRIQLPGARAVKIPFKICQPKISVTINADGSASLTEGDACSTCALTK